MHNINPDPKKRNTFSNFVCQLKKASHGFRAASFVERLKTNNICTQTVLDSTTTVNLSNSKEMEYLCESLSHTSATLVTDRSPERRSQPDFKDCESDLTDNQIRGEAKFGYQMTKNHCEGDAQKDLASLPFDRTFNVVNFLKQGDSNTNNEYEDNNTLDLQNMLLTGSALTKAYLEKNLNKLKRAATEVKSIGVSFKNISKPKHMLRSHSNIEKMPGVHCVRAVETDNNLLDAGPPLCTTNDKCDMKQSFYKTCEHTQTKLKSKFLSFMCPTISSERKNQSIEIKDIEHLISPTRKIRVKSPKVIGFTRLNTKSKNSDSALMELEKLDPDLKLLDSNSCSDLRSRGTSTGSVECTLTQALSKLRDRDWNIALRGLAEITELCKIIDLDLISPHMTLIYQKLIDLIKSPRSYVSRTSCQAVGHIFEHIKDTRRPEFDEIVDSLLCKCADCNRFIRQDANLALDCMVTHIPIFHAVRAICTKGPEHKNPLVRIAAARILVCALVLAGAESVINPSSNQNTRKRIIVKMAGFLEDRQPDVRKYGERIYKMMSKYKIFDTYLYRFLEKEAILKMKKMMKD